MTDQKRVHLSLATRYVGNLMSGNLRTISCCFYFSLDSNSSDVLVPQVLAFVGLDYSLNFLFAVGTLAMGVLNLLSAYHVCLTRGVGKNGSTVAVSAVQYWRLLQ